MPERRPSNAPSPARSPALTARGVTKTFGGARALSDVDLTIEPGEVHGLLGENGSGKSTFIKILAGYHEPEAGELEIHGKPVKLPLKPGQFREVGMSFVHQDLALARSLSVVENLYVGEIASSRHLYISWRRRRERARATFARYELSCDPSARVAELTPVERAMLAIVRAAEEIAGSDAARARGGLLVLDEPTVFLPKTQVDQLFALIRRIASHGASVLFVSHDLGEVQAITDRITVLRDGRSVGTVVTAQTTESRLVELIVGRTLVASQQNPTPSGDDTESIRVRGLSCEDVLTECDLSLRKGEIVGVTGLLGSGFEVIPYLLFGARRASGGTLTFGSDDQVDVRDLNPAEALARGIVLLPADRQRDGGVPSLTLQDNVTIPFLGDYMRRGVLSRMRMRDDTRAALARFDVRPPDPFAAFASLSGGNQQKALLAKWLRSTIRLLVLHEPTQGVDVGARAQITEIVKAKAGEGTAVLCASSDYEQLVALCSRVLILARGRVVAELKGDDVTKERLSEACLLSLSLPLRRTSAASRTS